MDGSISALGQCLAQYLLRALIYRAVVDCLFRPDKPERPDEKDFFLGPVELALRLAGA